MRHYLVYEVYELLSSLVTLYQLVWYIVMKIQQFHIFFTKLNVSIEEIQYLQNALPCHLILQWLKREFLSRVIGLAVGYWG